MADTSTTSYGGESATPEAVPAPDHVALPTDAQVREAMQTAWDDYCDDAKVFPSDLKKLSRGRVMFTAGVWADHTAMHLRAALATQSATLQKGAQALFEHEMRCRGVTASWFDVDEDDRNEWQASAAAVLDATQRATSLEKDGGQDRKFSFCNGQSRASRIVFG
jgi:hypothetical protein